MGGYTQAFGLSEVELYDATGNAFIPFEISQRLTPIIDHLAGEQSTEVTPRHAPPGTAQVTLGEPWVKGGDYSGCDAGLAEDGAHASGTAHVCQL